MSNKRGPYRQYLYQKSIPIPDSTRSYNRKKARLQLNALANINSNQIDLNQQQQKDVSLQPIIIQPISTNSLDSSSFNDQSTVENQQYDQQNNHSDNEQIDGVIDDDEYLSLTKDKNVMSSENLAIAYLVAFYNGNITQKSFEDFLKLNNLASTVKLPTSFDGIINLLLGKRYCLNYNTTWFCSYCSKILKNLTNRWQRSCEICNTRLIKYFDLDLQQQVIDIIQNNYKQLSAPHLSSSNGNLQDIRHGNLYKHLLESSDGHLLKNNKAFTFLINTDGVSLSEKSRLTMWPVYLVVNELPIEIRYSIENTILAGLSIGEEKPNFDVFLPPIVKQLKKLEYGIDILVEGAQKKIHFFLIAGIFDKPAKASVLNMIGSNGFYGCTKCYQPGASEKTSSASKGGVRHIYPFIDNNPKGPERTDQSYEDDVKTAIDLQKTSNGVKGSCILSHLKYFKPVSSTCIDYMHSLLEGVVKNFFRYWFDSDLIGEYSIRKFINEIDTRLLKIKPPKFVPSTPRSIYVHNLWRAHEYLSFILYYALPVFKDIMKYEYYQNLTKFVVIVEFLLSPSIEVEKAVKIDRIAENFIQEVRDLYPEGIMLSGMHEILHLVDCSLQFGPLNSINCFQFEEMNRKMMRLVHGYDLVGEELIKILSIIRFLNCCYNQIVDPELKKFVIKRLDVKTSNKKNLNLEKSMPNYGFSYTNDEQYLRLFEKFSKQTVSQLKISTKWIHNGIIYTSFHLNTKRDDSCIVTNCQKFGLIDKFVLTDSGVFVIAKQLVELYNPFFASNCPEIKSKSTICCITNQMFVEKIEHLKKAVFIKLIDSQCIVSRFSMSHLFH